MAVSVQSPVEALTSENEVLRARVAELERFIGATTAASATSPAILYPLRSSSTETISFSEAFDLDTIQAIVDALAVATGVASIITDPEGRPITRASNFCRLCSDIIRGTPQGLLNCMRSDALIGKPNPTGPTIQPCLSGGLIDGGVSIFVGERHVANWLIGQVLDSDADEVQMLAYAQTIGADEQEFRTALAEVTRMPRARFEQIAQVIDLIARQISALATQNYAQSRTIAAREAAEQELRIFKALVEHAPDGIGLADLEGTITYVNAAFEALIGGEKTVVGTSLASLIAPDEQHRLPTIMEQLLTRGMIRDQVGYLRADGTTFQAQFSALLIRDGAGQAMALASINRDISAQLRAEQERLTLQEQVIAAQQAALLELSTPLMPITAGVVVMPIVGALDSARAQQIMETLLEGIATHDADLAILDITGVKVVDTQVAGALIRAAQAASLLGTRVILSGIGPEIAQTLVHIGADLREMVAKRTLQQAIAFALSQRAR